MRKRYFTSHFKLPILILCVCISSTAYTNSSNTTCYAAQNKWICAPEDKQDLARKKSQEINAKNTVDKLASPVVIKPLTITKFKSSPTSSFAPDGSINVKKTTNTINPYKDLWSYQLAGVSTPQNAQNFVFQHNLSKKDVLIIKSTRNNTDWWVILYGLYKNKQTGVDDNANIPASIKEYWLRPLRNLEANDYIDEY